MDEETTAAFDALMARMNDGFERVNDRISGVEKRLGGIDQTLMALTELARATNTLLLDLNRRVTERVDHLQSEVRTIKEDLKGIRLTMVTRQDWVTDRDTIMARLENLEAEMALGFRQLNEKMDRQHAAVLALLTKD